MKSVVMVLMLWLSALVVSAEDDQIPVPAKKVGPFRAMAANGPKIGQLLGTADYPDAKGFIVVFSCNHCPFAKLYPARLKALHAKYARQGVPILVVSSMDTLQYEEDTYPEMIKVARNGNYSFPYLFDGEQSVAKAFGAARTPQAFVIWRAADKTSFTVKYQGAIDDNGQEPSKVKNRYLEHAVDALLAGKPVKTTATASIGCRIYFRQKT